MSIGAIKSLVNEIALVGILVSNINLILLVINGVRLEFKKISVV